ncbi:hypothetical protein MMC24_007486 [Lignoscripta atroalba]|nr:hypothetical protein [Lignoscripta atroalba]
MPSKTHDRERDRDREGTKARDKPRHKSLRTNANPKASSREGDNDSALPERSSTITNSSTRRRSSMPIPELKRRASSSSPHGSKISLPYPSFSKAHSKEAVRSREDVAAPRMSLFTPDPTDIQGRKSSQDGKDHHSGAPAMERNGPPSPPLTTVDQVVTEERRGSDLEKAAEEIRKKLGVRKSSKDGKTREEPPRKPSTKGSPWRSSRGGDKPTFSSLKTSKPSTPTKMKPRPVTIDDASSITSGPKSRSPSPTQSILTSTGTATESSDSNSTSIASKQPMVQQPFTPDLGDETSPASDLDSSPKTPTPRGTPFPPSRKETPAYDLPVNVGSTMGVGDSPMPPPPPPPPEMPFQIPKVDYLMQNGGLSQPVPRNFLAAGQPTKTLQNSGNQPSTLPVLAMQVEKFFAPFNGLLDDYDKVMMKNGSLAVATGYRSIARRLLDRLEAVFARDISSEICTCMICQSRPDHGMGLDDERGISWGEILEYVCGRQELPPWPAFILDSAPIGLGISPTENRSPMQKLDIDVPDEYREHYIRQSKKTKQSVDRWLANQSDKPSSPPQDVDDDTLTFAMLTHLEPEQRPILTTLLGVAPSRPASRAPTPLSVTKSDLLEKTASAIQRLYRLAVPPRDPECAIYLLNNPSLHNVLATIAAVSDGEWEILTSGRFDGFLRSGADDNSTATPSRGLSRGPTPAGGRFSRGPTPLPNSTTPAPASVGAPVAIDEETEIAVLAEIEREIYLGMEALEDAFEALHCKAENIRCGLRERGAGLSMASQARRGGASTLEARLGTPASGVGVGPGGTYGWESETDDGIDDAMSELAPDDSASNVSSSRHRRPKRRNERRTPALVEEEDEDASEVAHARAPRR